MIDKKEENIYSISSLHKFYEIRNKIALKRLSIESLSIYVHFYVYWHTDSTGSKIKQNTEKKISNQASIRQQTIWQWRKKSKTKSSVSDSNHNKIAIFDEMKSDG